VYLEKDDHRPAFGDKVYGLVDSAILVHGYHKETN